jgi:polyhydroxyalkanoate synthase
MVQGPRGSDAGNRLILGFQTRQFLDLISPSSWPWFNPEVVAATRASGGANLVAGMENFLRDQAAR